MKEKHLQRICEHYLLVQKIEFFHIPDTLFQFIYSPLINNLISKNRYVYQWLQGVRKLVSKYFLGLPDIIIFDKSGKYLAIELKTKTGKLREAQKKKSQKMDVKLCRDFNTFKSLVNEWRNNL